MRVMIRKNAEGVLLVYVAKKDIEELVIAMEGGTPWGGVVTLANGWRFQLPEMPSEPRLPVTVEARRLGDG